MRIDKYLWCVRLCKTRSIASALCQAGKVKVDGVEVKPAKELKVGNVFEVRENPIWREFKVLGFPKSRVGAKLVPDFLVELTDESLLHELATVQKMNSENRGHGIIGRPTKKQRRNLDQFKRD